MSGLEDKSPRPEEEGQDTDTMRIECKADRRVHDLDVEWMKGAIFEFESMEAAEDWVAEENIDVPGTLFLAETNDSGGQLAVDYHVKYNRPG
jgi:hypothetical protein